MRFADVHQDKVVFTYEGDLWLASAGGGDARRITNDSGIEQYAKFSPDGSRLAFTASYDGGVDVYVMDAEGGTPTRLTYHPADDNVLDWFPDGSAILFRSKRNYPFRGDQVYKVPVKGGMAERLIVDRAGLTAISPDGASIAYNRISTEFRTWKRYQGGMAPDIWMGRLDKGDYQKITNWPGTDSYPMWQGEAIYFDSDREGGTLNLFKYDVASKATTALTHYRDYDVKYPSIGPGAIVYQYGETLHLYDLAKGQSRKLDIHIPSNRTPVREWYVSAAENQGSFGLSTSGKRLLLTARGEVLNIPVHEGETINLTRSSGSREKNAAWSPDGKQIVFISDKSGEEELYLVDQEGRSPWKQLTKGNKGFRLQPVWSPDSKWIVFSDKYMRLNLVDAASGTMSTIAQGEYDDGWERWGIQDYVWSADCKWIAYTQMQENMYECVFLYSMEKKKSYAVTDDSATSWSPSFDPSGKYLYYLSNRTFEPIMSAVDHDHGYHEMCRPYLVVLKSGEADPFAPKAGLEEAAVKPEPEKKEEKKSDKKQPAEEQINVDGLVRRTVALEGVPAGNYFRLEAVEDGVLYLNREKPGFLKYDVVNDSTADELDLYHYKLEVKPGKKHKAEKLIEGISNYHLSADGKKLVYRAGGTIGVVDVGEEAKVGDGEIVLTKVKIKIDRNAEFVQIFNEAWRVQRDWFYDAKMHGVDWDAVGEMYRKFVPSCGNRSDLGYLIGELISELNAGHTYSYGGDILDKPKKIDTGMLGADFETPKDSAYHRIAHIVPGVNWDPNLRSPLAAPGCPIKEGDYIIAIDGADAAASDDVFKLLENKADCAVSITYNSKPSKDGAKECLVRTISNENAIRYREWVEGRRAAVAKATNGEVGYVHIPDMGEEGLKEFARAFYPQHIKRAIIIDDRYNGGGFVGDMIIDRLERRMWAVTKPREGKLGRNPEGTFHGHLALLINEDTGSNGEFFAEAIKRKGLAKVIGMRTWGGAIGIEPHQPLIDGGTCTPPQFGLFDLSSQWLIEGHGVDPDIEVQNMPADVIKGKDPQLEAAIRYLVEQLEKTPMELPKTPEYPDKAKH
jgi:tricorn protease